MLLDFQTAECYSKEFACSIILHVTLLLSSEKETNLGRWGCHAGSKQRFLLSQLSGKQTLILNVHLSISEGKSCFSDIWEDWKYLLSIVGNFFFSLCFEINASNEDKNPEQMKFRGSIICDTLLIRYRNVPSKLCPYYLQATNKFLLL